MRLIFPLLVAALSSAVLSAAAPPAAAEPTRGIPYLTLRDRTGDTAPDTFYGDERSGLKAGWCDVTQTDLSVLSPLADAASFHIPEEILRIEAVREADGIKVLDTLEATTADRAPLLYTHGFYIDFDKGCRRATVLQENVGLEGSFIWFSWPSDGTLLNYTRDEADLYWSVRAFEEIITELANRFGPGNFNLAGHSLGARGVALALKNLAAGHRGPNPLVGEVVLLAPDIDFEIFEQYLALIRPLARGITVYVTASDRPLALSRQVHGYPRLGETGNDVASLDGVEVIDLSDLPVRSPTGHLYHVYDPEVATDLRQLLIGGKRAGERRNLTRAGGNLWRLQPEAQ